MNARDALAARRVRRRRKTRITEDHVFAPVATDYVKQMRTPPERKRRRRKNYKAPTTIMGDEPRTLS